MDLRNRTTSELRTVFHSRLGVPNSQVPLYMVYKAGNWQPRLENEKHSKVLLRMSKYGLVIVSDVDGNCGTDLIIF